MTERQERQELVYLEQQALTELLVLKVQPAQQGPELREPRVLLALLELAEPLVPRVRAYLEPQVLLVQEYLAQLVLPEQLEQELPVLLVLLELVVPPEPLVLQELV